MRAAVLLQHAASCKLVLRPASSSRVPATICCLSLLLLLGPPSGGVVVIFGAVLLTLLPLLLLPHSLLLTAIGCAGRGRRGVSSKHFV